MYNYSGKTDDTSDEIYFTLVEDFGSAIFEGLSEKVSIKENGQLIWKNSRRYFFANPMTFALLERFIRSPLIDKPYKEQGRSFLLPVVELIDRGMAEGIIPKTSLPICIAVMYSPLISLIKHHHQGDLVLTEELAMSTFEMCWKAVQK